MPSGPGDTGTQRSSPIITRVPVKAIVTAVAAADLAVLAGWTQSLWLRVVLIILITAVAVVTQIYLGRRPRLSKASPPSLLPQEVELPFFHGRQEDLELLVNRHETSRRDALLNTASDRPTILAIHGPPGVGKTALAQRLALRLSAHYLDGQLYVSMGDEGQAREPREILLTLLGQLRWPEAEILGDTNIDAEQLAAIFRGKIASMRILILLDAVHSRAQLLQVLPGTSTCTVITTSRANLKVAGQSSHRLKRLTPEEATQILLRAYGNGGTANVDSVAEVIELCDYLPEALLAAGERARDEGKEGLARTVELLRDRERRLDALTYGGRNMANRIASEYNNLDDLEKSAFLLLTVPASETFVPWALQPLMDSDEIRSVQAGNLMAKISRGGLIELEGRDPSGFGRYRFSSFSRLFAEQRIRNGEIPATEMNLAKERFARAYFAGSLKVLARAGVSDVPDAPFQVPAYWYPEVRDWELKVAQSIVFWSRAEFGNLIHAILDAVRYGQPDACWLLAVQAGDCFSPSASHEDIRRAFEEAVNSAIQRSGTSAEIKVRLARSGYLAAVHDHMEAIAELTTVVRLAETSGDRAAQAEGLRRLGHAWQEIGGYRQAFTYLRDADAIARQARRRESRLIALLLAENEALTHPGHWADQLSCSGPRDRGDNSQFIEKMILSRAACRRRDPGTCDDLLTEARQHCDGNLAHRLDIEHGQAEMMLRCSGSPPTATVLRKAVTTLRSADQLGRPYAQVRARCTLAQALVHAGQPTNCLYQLAQAEPLLRALPAGEASGLTVILERTRGQALLALRRFPTAALALEQADRQLDQRASWARGEILVLLGIARRELRDHVAALAAHAAAVEIFQNHHDQLALIRAFDELCSTLRHAGVGRYHVWWIRRAVAREAQRRLP